MSAAPPNRIRCAIYTRKSTDEGLDQAYNSLHAQRNACQSYVLSQAGEGWTALPAFYDDGGFSGGNMERPALKRLLEDVAGGRIDVVVVYKIDRLTRALGDFARIVETFDKANVSFVSVTQAFNTTTSMGRLTLNVLLSFAQFEREVTGERIRDKIALSKARGMWMGGRAPLGYDMPTDPVTRALVVNSAEAASVRAIFERYLELGSVHKLQRELSAEGAVSKRYVFRSGSTLGGVAFSRGSLFHLLKNRNYVGELVHKDRTHPGAHPAIVERELFDRVQALLVLHTPQRGQRVTRVGAAPLRGRIFDADGVAMSPTFSQGYAGRLHRYYVTSTLQRGGLRRDDGVIRRVSAGVLETHVAQQLVRLLRIDAGGDSGSFPPALRRVDLLPNSVQLWIDGVTLTQLQHRLVPGEDVQINPATRGVIVTSPARLKLRGGRTWIEGGEPVAHDGERKPVEGVFEGLRKVHRTVRELGLFGPPALATRSAASNYERRRTRLAFLAPDLQRALLDGDHPVGITLEALINGDIPLAWADQRKLFTKF